MRRPLVLAAVPSSAYVANNVVVTAAFGYAPPSVSIAQDDTLTHIHADIAPQDVTAVLTGPDNLPILSTGGQSDVRRVSSLAHGIYAFYSVHRVSDGASQSANDVNRTRLYGRGSADSTDRPPRRCRTLLWSGRVVRAAAATS